MGNSIINKLNDIAATERRQALVYRRCASMVTGPYRDSLAEEFRSHAETEDLHTDIAVRHIVALGGNVDHDVKDIPVWHTFRECLNGLVELEEQGIKAWQELMRMLPDDDAFKHTIESVLDREQEHLDEAKRWQRDDFTEKSMSRSIGDVGSLQPLNLRLRKALPEAIHKSDFNEKVWQHARFGTPPTRWGAMNGVVPNTSPSVPAEMNPMLVLKAVIDPALAGGGAGGTQTSRKRDPSTGEFTATASTGEQSTAEEDAAIAERSARLAAVRYTQPGGTKKAFGSPSNGQQPTLTRPQPSMMEQSGVPGAPPGASANLGQQFGAQGGGQQQPIGTTPDGMPVFDDPYHPSHQQFTPEHHQAAAEMHNRQAEISSGSGQIPTALDHQLKAKIHGDMANDSQSPMQRMMGQQGGGQDAMDAFLTQMPDKQPGLQNMNPDQGKPNFGSPADNQGPLPRMVNTNTGTPIGPQTDAAQHAGTVSQQQDVPAEPDDGSSMPDIHQDPSVRPADVSPEFIEQANEEAAQDFFGEPPSSHAGATMTGMPEPGKKPTPGATESEPSTMQSGPSTNDSPKPSAASGPFTGNPLEDKTEKDKNPWATKSFNSWFNSI